MTLAIFIVIAAVLALVCILVLSVSRSRQVSSNTDLAARIQPLDVEAFRNLLNVADDEFLRRNLAGADFRLVQRARLRAMAAYVLEAWRNAGLLIQIGQAAMAGSDPHTAGAAQELVSEAWMVRRNALLAIVRIYVALTWPNSGTVGTRVFDRYQQLNRSAMLLGRLQNPAVAVRVAAR